MHLTPEQRAKIIGDTREHAGALLDDLQYLRSIADNADKLSAELRRASGVLRRLLVDRDLTTIANPRLGRFEFSVPDNNPFYHSAKKIPFSFFGSGGVELFGSKVRTLVIDTKVKRDRPPLDTGNRALVRLDGLLNQRVLFFEEQWITRGAVIKYVANVASGVHSGSAITPIDNAISRIRRSIWYSKANNPGNAINITMDMDAIRGAKEPDLFRYAPDRIDPALIEIFAAINCVLISDNTQELEAIIKAELA